MSNVKIAAQVYSVRELAQADFRKTMEGLREIGYEGVELAGLYGLTPTEVRDTLKETGLEAVSAHVGIDLFLEDLEGTVQDYRTIGCSYIGIPALKTDRHFGGEKFQETCAFIRKLSTCCAENGMVLLYHNHSFEFEKTPAGTYLLDEFYQALDADTIQTELDTCWVANGGESPVAYLEKYRGRCPLVHMKDSRRGQCGADGPGRRGAGRCRHRQSCRRMRRKMAGGGTGPSSLRRTHGKYAHQLFLSEKHHIT